MSTVRIFNPPRGRTGFDRDSGSGVYRPSFAFGHQPSDLVRERLVRMKIGKPAKGGKVLLNNQGVKATLRNAGGATAAPARPRTAAKKGPPKKAPAKGVSKACAAKGIKIPEAKARQILKDGNVRGKPLTKAQRGLMGLVAGGCKTPKSPVAKKRAEKLDAERLAKKPKKAPKAKKPAKPKKAPKAKKPAKVKKPAKAKAPKKTKVAKTKKPKKAKTARGKKTPKLLTATLTKAIVKIAPVKAAAKKPKKKSKGRAKSTELVPVSKRGPKGGKAKAASAKAKKAKAKKAPKTKGQEAKAVAATKKGRKHKSAAKKKHKAKAHNKGKKKHHKAKKSASKAKKHNKKHSKKPSKAKKHNRRKGKKRNAALLGGEGAQLAAILGVSNDGVPAKIRGLLAQAERARTQRRRDSTLTKKVESFLRRMEKAGEYVGPKTEIAPATLTGLAKLQQLIGLSAGETTKATKKATKKGKKKPASTAVTPVKKSKGKKHNKRPKAKKHNGRPKGSKNKPKKSPKKPKKAKKKGTAVVKTGKKSGSKGKRSSEIAKLRKALKGQSLGVKLIGKAKVANKGKRHKKAKKHNGGVLATVSNPGLGGVVDTVKGFAVEKIWEPIKWAAVRTPGLIAGAGASYAVPQLLMPDFVKGGVWQKAVGSIVGGVVGVVGSGLVAGLVRGEDEAARQAGAAAIGALGALLSSVLTKSTATDNRLRMLVGTDPSSLSDYLSDAGADVGPKSVKEEPQGLPQTQGDADEWSSALDYGDARFDPTGFTADEYLDPAGVLDAPGESSGLEDFAAPAMNDFAAPAMSDFAEAMGDDMGDFAAPGMGDFAAPGMSDFVGVVSD